MKAIALSIAVLALVTTSASAQQLRPWQPPSHDLPFQQEWDLSTRPTWQQENDQFWAEQQRQHERNMEELNAERRHQELLEELRQERMR
jgi:hypothetical protein